MLYDAFVCASAWCGAQNSNLKYCPPLHRTVCDNLESHRNSVSGQSMHGWAYVCAQCAIVYVAIHHHGMHVLLWSTFKTGSCLAVANRNKYKCIKPNNSVMWTEERVRAFVLSEGKWGACDWPYDDTYWKGNRELIYHAACLKCTYGCKHICNTHWIRNGCYNQLLHRFAHVENAFATIL